MDKFIIYVSDYLGLTTPYSDSEIKYDELDDLMQDLNYVLTYEIFKKKGEKNAQKKNEKVKG